jgi:hypothetical protein
MSTRFIEFQRHRQIVQELVNLETPGIRIPSLSESLLLLNDRPLVNRSISHKLSAMGVTPVAITLLYVVVINIEI